MLTVSNQIQITEYNTRYVDKYPRWSPDEKLIIYDSEKTGRPQIYVYRLSDGVTKRITTNESISYQYGNFENCPK
jgi:Tol biopolymer transport system component